MRRFDPADQRSTGTAGAFTLMPASEALLDEDSIKRFRARYRETFGANATGDPLYQAVSDGRRLAGMEHWLPLFEDKLATLFDHLGDARRHRPRRRAPTARSKAAPRRSRIITATAARRWSPSPAAIARSPRRRSTSPKRNGRRRSPRGRSTSPRPSPSPPATRSSTSRVEGPRDFAPERAQNANVYEAVVKHIAKLRKDKKKVVLASYTVGARERLAGLLDDHGLTSVKLVDSWQAALGAQGRRRADRAAARPRLHRARRRRPDRAGHARRPAGPAQEAPQERRRLPQPNWPRSAPATSSSTPTMASRATRG